MSELFEHFYGNGFSLWDMNLWVLPNMTDIGFLSNIYFSIIGFMRYSIESESLRTSRYFNHWSTFCSFALQAKQPKLCYQNIWWDGTSHKCYIKNFSWQAENSIKYSTTKTRAKKCTWWLMTQLTVVSLDFSQQVSDSLLVWGWAQQKLKDLVEVRFE